MKRTGGQSTISHPSKPDNTLWSTLASGAMQHNTTDFYTATNFNGNYSSKSYNNQGMRAMRPGVGGFHGNVNILLGG